MGIMSTLVDAFSPGGVRGQQHQRTEEQIQKQEQTRLDQEASDRHRDSTFKMHDQLMQQGYRPSVGGMVQESYADLPGFSSPAQTAGSDLPSGVPLPGTSTPAIAGASFLRPIDKARAFSMKDHTGEEVTYERPSEMEIVRNLVRQHAPVRDAAVEEAGAVAKNTRAGQLEGDQQERQGPSGVEVPSALDESLPGISMNGTQRRRVLPKELDDIVKSAGSYANYKSEADNRGKPKANEVQSTHISTADDGTQTQITTYKDGTSKETALTAKGQSKTVPSASDTSYRQARLDLARDAAMEKRVQPWQKRIEDAQTEEDKRGEENVEAGRQMVELGTQLQNGTLGTVSARAKAKRDMGTLQAKIDGNNQRIKTLHSVKKNAQGIKDNLFGGGGKAQQPSSQGAKVATRAQVKKYATQNGMDEAAALKAFKDDGIQVGP